LHHSVVVDFDVIDAQQAALRRCGDTRKCRRDPLGYVTIQSDTGKNNLFSAR
jgi:hypothetical protein